MKKVTDLEEFTLTHIIRPFQGEAGALDWNNNYEKSPINIDDMVDFARNNNAWWNLVMDRIKFYFLTKLTCLKKRKNLKLETNYISNIE